MNDFGLVKNFTANGTINKNRVVAIGASEGEAVQATGNNTFIGVSGVRGAAAAGDRVDVYMDEIRNIEFGGNVSYGDWLTSDADGKAITAAPASGAQMNVIGKAMTSGVAGSIGQVHVSPQQITG
jgi:hypothetical protein